MESEISKKLKTLSKTALKVIIQGTGLKTKYEIILWKFYIEDKSYVEISDDMGIEITSVGKTLWKAKKELERIILKEKKVIPPEIYQYIEILLAKE